MAVARVLFTHRATFTPFSSESVAERSGCIAAAYMHAGLALENAIKAHLVHRNPVIVRNDGTLDRKLLGLKSGHGITALCELVFPDIEPREYRVLAKLEEHVVWLGKYTTPLKAAPLYDGALMDVLRLSTPDEVERIESLFARLVDNVPRASGDA
jgi:hypothetical protein